MDTKDIKTAIKKTKTCKICGRILPLSEFHKQSSIKDGHTTACKACVSVKSLKRRSSLEFKIKQKEYNQTHKERNTFLKKRWEKNHPEKFKEYNKNKRKSLKKSYIVDLLLQMGFNKEDITLELIETKRAIVRTKRILWNK